MPKHYLLSPSGAHRWLVCPGSLVVSKGQPDTASVYANEGTHAHLIASEALEQCINAADVERECSEEMAEAVQKYLDTVREIKAECLIKENIEVQMVSEEIDDFGGTVDWLGLFASKESGEIWIHICDYKHGVGVPVICEENEQMLCYALLAREIHGRQDFYRATIVQPRTNGPAAETWEISNEMLDAFEKRIHEAVAKPTEFRAGEHCRWCPALQICDVVHNIAIETAKIDFAVENTPRDNVAKWTELMNAAPAIKALLAKIPRMMLEDMKRGVEFPGYKAVMSVGNRKWQFEDDVIVKRLIGRKIYKMITCPRKLLSPTQIEKLGYGPQIEDLVTREEKGPTVVPLKDRREALELVNDIDDMSYLL